MDIKKLKYDLSMQCAVIDILKNSHPVEDNPSDFDMRIRIMDAFEAYYRHFSVLDESRWEVFEKLDEELDKKY